MDRLEPGKIPKADDFPTLEVWGTLVEWGTLAEHPNNDSPNGGPSSKLNTTHHLPVEAKPWDRKAPGGTKEKIVGLSSLSLCQAPSRAELNPHKTSPTGLQQQEQKPTRNHTRNLPETYQDHIRNLPGNLPGTCQEPTRNLPGTYREPTRNLPNLPGTYKGPTGNTRNLPGTSQEPQRNLPGT